MDSRRSTAMQFFTENHVADTEAACRRIVEWLNLATLETTSRKLEYLRSLQEYLTAEYSSLLDNFLDEIMGFQSDRDADVRKFVINFIEEACKKDPDVIPKVISNLALLLTDKSVAVQKRAIQATNQIYKGSLIWLSKARTVTEEMENAWNVITSIKSNIFNLIDSDNDGIRTHTVKFLETVILLQTYPEDDSLRRTGDFSLDNVPLTLKIARRRKLEEEANMLFDSLVKFHGSPHISSVNLMTCMGSLTLIAKMRPQFMGKVVSALETLHTNLPPTLSKSQVSSVRKHLKMQLLNLLRHPSSIDYQNLITTLLTDLGSSTQEIQKAYPKVEEVRKRQKRLGDVTGHYPKKPKLDVDDDEEEEADGGYKERKKTAESTVDITEQYIADRLVPDVVANLVMASMNKLPDSMPSHFVAMYTPVAAAGTYSQIKHVARLLATQLTSVGVSPASKKINMRPIVVADDDDDFSSSSKTVSGAIEEKPSTAKANSHASSVAKSVKHRLKTLKLSEVTKPLGSEAAAKVMKESVLRILNAEKHACLGGVRGVRNKIITTVASSFNPAIRKVVLDHILDDLRSHLDLAFAWLYEEYSYMQGFSRKPAFLKQEQNPEHSYNSLFCAVARTLQDKIDGKERDLLLNRLYLESPLITEEGTDIMKHICSDPHRASEGLKLLQTMVIKRPPRQLVFLNVLLEYTAHENFEIRSCAIKLVVELYDRGDLRSIIEEYAIFYLSFLRLAQPPEMLFGAERGRPNKSDKWSEDMVKVCLYLYLALLPINEKLIHELARVYVQTVADVKRTILRLLKEPVRGMGMDSPQLLTLVERCPKGAETLVTRVIHILTDQTPPSAELVARVRDLYHTRVSDVRFLIPVLNGLTKKEVIAALPKLIKLNPVVVKEVFNRLLGTHNEGVAHTSPLTPGELLIALHNIDPSKCELKTVIKATSLCFAEKQAYTQEILAVVMQHLMEQNPLPTLLMRTVIQSLSLYPRLIGFVMNILQRLILKQVWKQKKVWEGFIKCCQRTRPQSFQVLLQLPTAQLIDVFENSPDLKQPLLNHVMSFTENQRAHIPQSIMDVLVGNQRVTEEEYDMDTEPVSPPELTIDIREDPEDPNSHVEPAPPGLD